MKLVNFRRLKIGRRSRSRERKNEIFHLTSIKDKFYLKQDLKLAENSATEREGDR